MTYISTNAHGSRVKTIVVNNGKRVIRRRMQFVRGQWVVYARSSRPAMNP